MRILYFSDFFRPYIGGVEVLSAALLPELASRGHEVLAVSSHGNLALPDEEDWGGISVVRLPFRSVLESGDVRGVGRIVRRLVEIKRSFAPDVIHLGMVGPAALFHQQSSRAVSVPTLATVQTELGTLHANTLAERLLRASSWVRFVSRRLLEATCDLIPELRERASVIYGFFAPEGGPVRPPAFEPPRLLCLGRLAAEKNLGLAVETFARVRLVRPEVRLAIAGEGPEREALVQRTVELGVAESVDFLGRVEPEAVPALLDDCTALLLTSTREGLPNAAVAAATRARPVVATRVGSVDEVVVDRSTGYLAEASASALAGAVLRLLEDPAEAARMGARARDRATRLFDRGQCVDAFETLYERVRAG